MGSSSRRRRRGEEGRSEVVEYSIRTERGTMTMEVVTKKIAQIKEEPDKLLRTVVGVRTWQLYHIYLCVWVRRSYCRMLGSSLTSSRLASSGSFARCYGTDWQGQGEENTSTQQHRRVFPSHACSHQPEGGGGAAAAAGTQENRVGVLLLTGICDTQHFSRATNKNPLEEKPAWVCLPL